MFQNVNNQSASMELLFKDFLGLRIYQIHGVFFCGNSHLKMVLWNLGVHSLVWVNMLHSFISRVKVDYHLHPLTMPK